MPLDSSWSDLVLDRIMFNVSGDTNSQALSLADNSQYVW